MRDTSVQPDEREFAGVTTLHRSRSGDRVERERQAEA
jgi:hypothetical protein